MSIDLIIFVEGNPMNVNRLLDRLDSGSLLRQSCITCALVMTDGRVSFMHDCGGLAVADRLWSCTAWSSRRSYQPPWVETSQWIQCIVNFESSLMRINFNIFYVIDLATSYCIDLSWNFCRRKSLNNNGSGET